MQRAPLFQRPRRRFPDMDPGRRRLVIAGLVASALLFLGGFAASGYLWRLSRQFPEAPFAQPPRGSPPAASSRRTKWWWS
jgi:hypothetical protein